MMPARSRIKWCNRMTKHSHLTRGLPKQSKYHPLMGDICCATRGATYGATPSSAPPRVRSHVRSHAHAQSRYRYGEHPGLPQQSSHVRSRTRGRGKNHASRRRASGRVGDWASGERAGGERLPPSKRVGTGGSQGWMKRQMPACQLPEMTISCSSSWVTAMRLAPSNISAGRSIFVQFLSSSRGAVMSWGSYVSPGLM
jgi:hypothetical protein